MGRRKAWVATVQLLVLADSEAEACDAVSETLYQEVGDDACVLDWGYLKVGGQRMAPTEYDGVTIDVEKYREGEFMGEGYLYRDSHD